MESRPVSPRRGQFRPPIFLDLLDIFFGDLLALEFSTCAQNCSGSPFPRRMRCTSSARRRKFLPRSGWRRDGNGGARESLAAAWRSCRRGWGAPFCVLDKSALVFPAEISRSAGRGAGPAPAVALFRQKPWAGTTVDCEEATARGEDWTSFWQRNRSVRLRASSFWRRVRL